MKVRYNGNNQTSSGRILLSSKKLCVEYRSRCERELEELKLSLPAAATKQTTLQEDLKNTSQFAAALSVLQPLAASTIPAHHASASAASSHADCINCKALSSLLIGQVVKLAQDYSALVTSLKLKLSLPQHCGTALAALRTRETALLEEIAQATAKQASLEEQDKSASSLLPALKACIATMQDGAAVSAAAARVVDLNQQVAKLTSTREKLCQDLAVQCSVSNAVDAERSALRQGVRAAVASTATAMLAHYIPALKAQVGLHHGTGVRVQLYGARHWQSTWSKGETQLVLVSLAFALRRLVLSRLRLGVNLLFLDEAFSNVDVAKMPQCLSWIWHESVWYARRCRRPITVYIIAHVMNNFKEMFRRIEPTRHDHMHIMPIARILRKNSSPQTEEKKEESIE